MTDAIMGLLELINSLILSVSGNTSPLTAPLGGFMGSMYSYSLIVLQNVAMPVAYTVLALFFVMELYKASVKVEGAGGGNQLGAEMVFRVMIKMVICKMVLDETPNILKAIYNATTEITTLVSGIVSGGSATGGMDTAALEPVIGALGFWGGIPVIIIVCIILLITLVAVGLANVIIVARFVELFVYLCISPIPIATLPNEEMSQIGKNFLKSFAAVCVQGTLIFLVLSFFPILFNSGFLENSGAAGSIYLSLLGILGYSIVLVLAIFATGKWAKSICHAM
jgi:hypothetical protein